MVLRKNYEIFLFNFAQISQKLDKIFSEHTEQMRIQESLDVKMRHLF